MIKKILCGLVFFGALAGSAVLPASAQVDVNLRFGPPAPIYEAVPPPPGPYQYWRPGYWHWNGNRYVWFRGEYIRRPYETAHWVPEHYVHGPHGYWHLVAGHWAG